MDQLTEQEQLEEADIESDDELGELHEAIIQEIFDALAELAPFRHEPNCQSRLAVDIQPTSAVLLHAARAAAEVFIAFERGYRLGTPPENR